MYAKAMLPAIAVVLLELPGCGGATAAPEPVGGEALVTAACDGDLVAVRQNVAAGVSVDFRSQNGGVTGLVCASRNGYLPVVQFLIESGADVNRRDNFRDKSALLAASWKYHLDIVQYLLAHGADPDAQGVNGWTPLHDAGCVGKLDVVRALVGAGADLHILNELGMTPLQTTQNALTACSSRDPHCPITQGDTDATLDDYRAVVAFLTGAGG